MLLWLALAVLVASLVHFLLRRRRLLSQLPPLAPAPPILGDSRFARGDSHEIFARISRELASPAITVEVKGALAVVLNDAASANELLVRQKEAYPDRPGSPALLSLQGGNWGLLFANGSLWAEQRRFALHSLRDLGLGRPVMENSIQEEVTDLIHHIEAAKGEPIDVHKSLANAVGNVISRLVFGRRFGAENNERVQKIAELTQKISPMQVAMQIPRWLQSVLASNPVGRALIAGTELGSSSLDYRNGIADLLKQSRHQTQAQDTYVSAFREAAKNGSGDFFDEHQLEVAVGDLFGAGMDTTTNTVRWIILHLCREPNIQEEAFHSIQEAVGLERLPTMSDRGRLPFIDAIIAESLRLMPLVAMTNRRSVAVSTLGPWTIPKGTLVFANIYAAHREPSAWEEPEEWRPKRFLHHDGSLIKEKVDQLTPFGHGKRKCLGESVARMELFLFTAALLQRFHFATPTGQATPSLDDHYRGLVLAPFPFQVLAKPRLQ